MSASVEDRIAERERDPREDASFPRFLLITDPEEGYDATGRFLSLSEIRQKLEQNPEESFFISSMVLADSSFSVRYASDEEWEAISDIGSKFPNLTIEFR